MDSEAIVVGGSMAGMSCARKLKENGRDVLIITDELGERVCFGPKCHNNFGAVFCMDNYANAFKTVDKDDKLAVSLGQLMLHSSCAKELKGTSATMIASLPQLLTFRSFMNKSFIPEYGRYKKDCETTPAKRAFEAHLEIAKCYQMKASELMRTLGIEKTADNFINKFAYACTGSRITELDALDFLNVAQGVVIKLCSLTFDQQKFIDSLDGRAEFDTVTSVEVYRTKSVSENGR